MAFASYTMPQSILKKSRPLSSTVPAREERSRKTAFYHAQLLQQRKDMEALILTSTEALLDLPTSSSSDPAHPSLSDAAFVRSSLKPFQPSDYDVLIEERNISHQCGYVLCPRHNRKQDTKARYRILQGTGKGSNTLKFVLRESLEKWCSDDCGKRALYIKVRLNEEPSWTRADPSAGEIALLEDKQNGQDQEDIEVGLVQGILNLNMGKGEDQIVGRMQALAIERGDGSAPSRSRGFGDLNVQEKMMLPRKSLPDEPTIQNMENVGQNSSIEGYRPRFLNNDARSGKTADDEKDIMGTI